MAESNQATQTFPVMPSIAAHAHVDAAGYRAMCARAASDPDGFWAEQAARIDWITPPTRIKNTHFTGDVSIKWYEDGELNAAASTTIGR
jgi:acetyl-CoA synthetase